MGYAVKELFYTLQGEGFHAGRAAVFLRFAGCNLWSGRPEDRGSARGSCAQWCDTDFVGTDGDGGGHFSDATSLAQAAARHFADKPGTRRFIVCTGGEPLLQLDGALLDALHAQGFEVAIETNGTLAVPPGVDWVCVSPKVGAPLVVTRGQELKVVVPQQALDLPAYEALDFAHFYVQPCDGPDRAKNLRYAMDICLQRPRWQLRLQTHKLIGIR